MIVAISIRDLTKPEPPPRRLMTDWRRYAALPEEELAKTNLCFLNLVCSLGLPGSEGIDLHEAIKTLEIWAQIVERWTTTARIEYFLKDPAQFQNSEAFFRCVSLIIALQRHCNVRYDERKIGLGPDAPFEFDDYFVRGVLAGDKGTCATLPIIYATIGRRLGYPIKLVCAKRHLFCRWDDPTSGTRINIEGASEGFNSYEDQHYLSWPAPIRLDEETRFGYLQSLTPSEELALFISSRAAFLEDRLCFREAANAYAVADGLDLKTARCSSSLLDCLRQWRAHLQTRFPPGLPKFFVEARPHLRKWHSLIPWEVEREFAALEGLESMMDDSQKDHDWWHPMRHGLPPLRPLPVELVYCYPQPEAP